MLLVCLVAYLGRTYLLQASPRPPPRPPPALDGLAELPKDVGDNPGSNWVPGSSFSVSVFVHRTPRLPAYTTRTHSTNLAVHAAILSCVLLAVCVDTNLTNLAFCFLWLQGWYIVTYALGIYLLNLLIAFLSPKIDPALAELEDGESTHIPRPRKR